MEPMELLDKTRDALTVQRVFGEPFTRDGVTIVPVAKVSGGGGGGGGSSPDERGSGSGAGFGLAATPAGVYVIKGDSVAWQPAIDVNRVILGAQVVAVVGLLVLRTYLRHRRAR